MKVYADEGLSAHTDTISNRLQLVQLLEDARRGGFDCVVVHMLDRWACNVGVQRQALKQLGESSVGFASVTEDVDFTTPSGRLLLTTMGGVSEFFSDQLSLHVQKAQKQSIELGLPVGPVPFGYKRQEEKKLPPVKVELEVEAVKEGFHIRDEGNSYGEIAIWLKKHGFHTREGHDFTAHAVRDMLDNHFYCGYVKYKGKEYPGKHEAIISEELFQHVQSRKQIRQPIRSVHGPKGLLQGIVACSHCGNGLQSDRYYQKVPIYRERHAHECPTNETSIVAEVIDKQVAVIVHSLVLNPDWKQQMVTAAVSSYEGPRPEDLREKRRRLGEAYADGAFTDNEYKERLTDIDRQLEQTSIVTPPDIEQAVELFSNLPMLWNEATTEERRTLLKSLVELVYVDIKTKQVTAIKPTHASRALYGVGINAGPDTPVKLMFHDKTPILLEMVETGENRTFPETRNIIYWLNSYHETIAPQHA
jgi:DNA invertase Pin-like site-specific DNA recombinase